MDQNRVYVIAGPTATGKTGLGIRLADKLAAAGKSAAIINMDSMQLYAEIPIVTAQPSPAERAQAPHLLYGILPASDACSAARYADMAAATIREVQDQGITPILLGGTGLYLKVLLEGIASIPAVEDHIREEARALAAEIGAVTLHAKLAQVDPESAARLQPADSQRVTRAWEVYQQTGRPISQWQRENTKPVIAPDSWQGIMLLPPREALYAKIDLRFHQMVDEGVVEEVAALMRQHLEPQLPAMKAVGLPEIAAYIRGERTLEEAIARAQQMSRNYAKRQTTWFTNQVVKKYPQSRAFTGFGADIDPEI